MLPRPTTLLIAALSVGLRKLIDSGTRKVDDLLAIVGVDVVGVGVVGFSSRMMEPGWPRSASSTSCNMTPTVSKRYFCRSRSTPGDCLGIVRFVSRAIPSSAAFSRPAGRQLHLKIEGIEPSLKSVQSSELGSK